VLAHNTRLATSSNQQPSEVRPMKVALFIVAIICLVAAGMYVMMPADQLPTFFPGFDPTLARPRLKHGIAAGIVGVLLFIGGWYVGRARA
jgi:hypothetical protein